MLEISTGDTPRSDSGQSVRITNCLPAECGDDVVNRVETYLVAFGSNFVNAVRKPVPGEQRVFDGSRATACRLPPEFLNMRLQ